MSSSATVVPAPASSAEYLQDEYAQALQSALDSASSAFFATHSSLSADAQKQLQASWCDAQQQAPYRPTTALAKGTAASNGVKTKKKVRAYIDGCYDVMHSGHYNAIRQAKSLCDELVVGLHSNVEILSQKGPPVMSDEERLATVRACKWVSEVVFDTPYNPTVALLDQLQCDFCVHGDDDALGADGTDAFAEVKAKGRMAIVKRTEGVSTTDLVNRLLQRTKTTARNNNDNGSDSQLLQAPDAHSARTLASSPQLIQDAEAAVAAAVQVPDLSLSSLSPAAAAAPASTFLLTTWRISQFANHRIPSRSDKVVYIAGSFDLFHLGHIEKLAAAKKLGTFLYVGIYDDATIRSYKGGAVGNSPIMGLHERVLNVLQCKYVDEVVMGGPWTITPDLLKTLNVSRVARAQPSEMSLRHSVRRMPDPTALIQSLGIVTEITTPSNLHTDAVVQRILDNRAKYEARNLSRAAKETAYAAKKEYVEEK